MSLAGPTVLLRVLSVGCIPIMAPDHGGSGGRVFLAVEHAEGDENDNCENSLESDRVDTSRDSEAHSDIVVGSNMNRFLR